MGSPDALGQDQPVYLESQTFVRQANRYAARMLLFLAAPIAFNPQPASISVSLPPVTVTNSTPQTAQPPIIQLRRTDYVESPVLLRNRNKDAAAFLLMSQAETANNTQINVPIGQVSVAALAPTEINTTTPMPWWLPPTYVETQNTVVRSSRYLDAFRWMLLNQPTLGPVIAVPTATVSLAAPAPTEGVGLLWLYLPSDDGWWYEDPIIFKLNPNYNFLMLAAPTTPPPINIPIPNASVSLATFAPNVVASGNGYNQTIPTATVSLGTQIPTVIQINSLTVLVPVAQITLGALTPTLTALGMPFASITMAAYPPTIGNTSQPTIWDATQRCVNAGLIIGQDQWVTNPFIPYGYVISQNPPSGTVVAEWTVVNFVVSFGPGASQQQVTVPNVVGLEARQAESACWAVGMDVGQRSYAYSSTVSSDYVIAQSVAAGIQVYTGTPISMTVSIGPAPTTTTVTVP
jgi:hypothetical protein